jgi:hypothetical protein
MGARLNITIKFMLVIGLAIFSGCKSAPISQQDKDTANRLFKASNTTISGLFVYRNSGFTGKTSVKSLWLDGKLVGELPNRSYYYLEISPGAHTLSTEAVFGKNDLLINTFAGKNYYVSQVFSPPVPVIGVVFGAFISSARFEAVSEADGQYRVLQCHNVSGDATKSDAETAAVTSVAAAPAAVVPAVVAKPAIAPPAAIQSANTKAVKVVDDNNISKVAKNAAPPAPAHANDEAAQLEKLKNLKDRGLISESDYNKKKEKILDGM